jgi:hypothetical protein
MARKIKKERAWKSQPSKSKSCILPVLAFSYSDLNILSYRSPFDANIILLDSLLEDLSAYQITVEKELICD